MDICKFCKHKAHGEERLCQTSEETLHGVGCYWMEQARREEEQEANYEAADPDGWKYSRMRP